jgi:hypothetical protein
MVTSFIETKVSIDRIQRFLLKEDIPTDAVDTTALRNHPTIAARMVNASFQWGEDKQTLKSIFIC